MKMNFFRTAVASLVLLLMANSPVGTCETFPLFPSMNVHGPKVSQQGASYGFITVYYPILGLLFLEGLAM
jgi:hypothetical protein